MPQTLFQVDAFTDRPFAGNPAAVCLLNQSVSEKWMLSVASEMNLSETAFLIPQHESFQLRWFTPKKEVRLCGHATLASAHVLWETGILKPTEQARFDTLSGRLTAERRGDWIDMDFPARYQEPAPLPDGLAAALGVEPIYTGKREAIYLVQVKDEETVRELQPNFSSMAALPVRSVIVTAKSGTQQYDFVSRYFAPGVGVNEDPVTGSAHCYLATYWGERMGKTELIGYQASARGGIVKVRVNGDRVILSGQAVTVLTGALLA
jgi:PhzF family phenazine biosynthesis protein